VIDGRGYVLEYPLPGDFALVAAHRADELGNLDVPLADGTTRTSS
jgi:3-oxoadipate CoA-transferase alpha subunit